ncbi:oxidoreductase [Sphingomonas sp. PAMC 26621]|uniref:oxidoreductase n=1 Tax=Sphingomonas sp. PAMC 26621 TaxID=1112213 RepID=UPI000289B3A9|nr:oxidoreductase [Sphingomonas sp. PAMC 26621]
MSAESPIRVGLIGYGLAGASFHAPLITALDAFALTTVVTSRADSVAQAMPDARVESDVAAVLADPAIDLIVIAAPDAQHAPLARAALAAGKHVVIDKPFVTDPADGAALVALAEAQRLMLSVFHNRRWDGDFLTVRRLLDEGVLGEVALAEFRWDRFRPAIKTGWRETPGAGLLNDLGPHLIDQAVELFGMPEAVTGDLASQRGGAAVEDYVEATLHYGARRVIVSAATLVAAPRARFALHGTSGSFVKYGIDPQEAVLRGGGSPRDPGYGVDAVADHGVLTLGDGSTRTVPSEPGDWRAYYAGVAAAIREQAAPPVSAGAALDVMRLIALVRQSAREGRTIPCPPGDV